MTLQEIANVQNSGEYKKVKAKVKLQLPICAANWFPNTLKNLVYSNCSGDLAKVLYNNLFDIHCQEVGYSIAVKKH